MHQFLSITAIAAAIFFVAPPQTAAAAEVQARCKFVYRGEVKFKGPCTFTAQRGGSFAVNWRHFEEGWSYPQDVFGGLDLANGKGTFVATYGPDDATPIRSGYEWGVNFHRSKKDKACWVDRSKQAEVCVW